MGNHCCCHPIRRIHQPVPQFSARYDQIAVLRRSEALLALLGIFSSVVILLSGGSVLALTISAQVVAAGTYLVVRQVATQRDRTGALHHREQSLSATVWAAAWPSAWRSGVTVLMSYGLLVGSGTLYAQFGRPEVVAAYLLALRFATTISDFSRAPFYTKIPRLARLQAQGNTPAQVRLAESSMRLSYIAYVIPIITLGLFGQRLLTFLGSAVQFPPPELWTLLCLALFFERVAAMHIQLYSTTNHIVTHIATLLNGICTIIMTAWFFGSFQILAFPLALLVSNLFVLTPYCLFFSYRHFPIRAFSFELHTSAVPLALCSCLVL